MSKHSDTSFLSVVDASRALGVSLSTVWRLLRRGDLPSLRKGGRRFIPKKSLVRGARRRQNQDVPPLTRDHPIFRLAGAGRGGGNAPGARDKHGVLDA